MKIFQKIIKFLIFYFVNISLVECKTLRTTVTTNSVNFANFQTIVNLFQKGLSQCPTNYTISVVPYNLTAPFLSPENTNDFQAIQLVFGPSQYFQPSFYGFKSLQKNFSFQNNYVADSFMNFSTRLNLMLNIVNGVVANDATKTVVFVLNGSNVDPSQPWKSFNPLPYLSKFKGSLNIQKYSNPGDGLSVCSGILASGAVTIAMDLSRVGALDVLSACNDLNLLNWRIRWLVFFSSLSYGNFTQRPNVTIFDFAHDSEYSAKVNPTILEEQDILFSDFATIAVRMMDSECNIPIPSTLTLRTGQFSINSGVVTRTSWNLDIYQLNTKTGFVQILNGIVTTNYKSLPLFNSSIQNLLNEMRTKPYRVAAMQEKPYAYYVNGSKTGHSVELIIKILTNLNVTYNITFYELPSGTLSSGKLNGMLGIAQNGQADIVIGAINPNLVYQSYVDFTNLVITDTIGILYKINSTNLYYDMFEFVFAFNPIVWILFVVSFVTYGVVLTLVNLISPNQTKFTIGLSILFTMGSIVQGITTALPDKISGRILVVFWWIFNIAILLTYVANYGAILTNIRLQGTINQLSDLFQQNTFSYGTIINSAVDYFLQTSASAEIQNVNQVIRTQYANIMPKTLNESLQLVNNTDISLKPYAFIYGNSILKQYTNLACYVLVSGTDQVNYTYALPLNNDYTNIINAQISSLDPAFLANLYTKYFSTNKTPDCNSGIWLNNVLNILGYEFIPHPMNSLNINRTAGIFVLMIFGIIIAVIAGIVELIVRKCKKKKDD